MKRLALAAALCLPIAAAHADPGDPTGPQPKLPTEQLTIIDDNGKAHVFNVELPVSQQEQDTGEMFRTSIPPDAGMLFLQPHPQVWQMWMKNCPVPEDMVFINPNGTIASIAEMTVPYSLKTISSGVPVLATLELQGGITATDNISTGDKVIAKQFTGG
jgi:uncharacterized membrane protein (UPF0127 family)